MTIISLLDLPLELPSEVVESRGGLMGSFLDGIAEYLSRCKSRYNCDLVSDADSLRLGQTFEGGISGSPGVEAHGAYAFCALACLSILGPPEEMIPRYKLTPIPCDDSFMLTPAKAYESPPTPVMAIGSTVRA